MLLHSSLGWARSCSSSRMGCNLSSTSCTKNSLLPLKTCVHRKNNIIRRPPNNQANQCRRSRKCKSKYIDLWSQLEFPPYKRHVFLGWAINRGYSLGKIFNPKAVAKLTPAMKMACMSTCSFLTNAFNLPFHSAPSQVVPSASQYQEK